MEHTKRSDRKVVEGFGSFKRAELKSRPQAIWPDGGRLYSGTHGCDVGAPIVVLGSQNTFDNHSLCPFLIFGLVVFSPSQCDRSGSVKKPQLRA